MAACSLASMTAMDPGNKSASWLADWLISDKSKAARRKRSSNSGSLDESKLVKLDLANLNPAHFASPTLHLHSKGECRPHLAPLSSRVPFNAHYCCCCYLAVLLLSVRWEESHHLDVRSDCATCWRRPSPGLERLTFAFVLWTSVPLVTWAHSLPADIVNLPR